LQKIGLASAPRSRQKETIGGVAEGVFRQQIIRQLSGQLRAMVEEDSHGSISKYVIFHTIYIFNI
jgi:hypothetical protein